MEPKTKKGGKFKTETTFIEYVLISASAKAPGFIVMHHIQSILMCYP